ncbi:MAG: hypothetical protein QME71_02860 [Dehalococcoidia bacterium]|nr:hypothetical protein [Dehalococcoidia bacterium]
MANPLSFLAPALEVLGKGTQILPASGGAVEYLQRPDQEELEDALVHAGEQHITAFLEDPEPSIDDIYRLTPPISRSTLHQFRFFIDGSLRTYFLGSAVEDRRSFPIELAQVGATVVERADDGRLRIRASRHEVLLLVPHAQGGGLSTTLWSQLEKLSVADAGFRIIDFDVPDLFTKDSQRDPRDKAGAKARYRMHQLEIELIKETDTARSDDAWLILDGAVKLDQFIEAPYLLGAAKSFRKDPEFHFGRGRGSRRGDITTILAGLPHGHRTVALSSHGGKVAFWYVRLREQKEVDYPLMGVIKVEMPRPDGTPVPAEVADRLSSCLVAERNVTPYGRDARWHCHLYPIFVAEQAIKTRFYSQEVLMGAIRWPRQTPALSRGGS